MRRIISEVRPRFVFVENSPMLASRGGVRVIADLASLGYDARWGVVGGKSSGLVVDGKRMWIVAYAPNSIGRETPQVPCQGTNPKESSRRQFERASSSFATEEDHAERLRNIDGMARDMDRLRAIGNGQVPQCMALAWNILCKGIAK